MPLKLSDAGLAAVTAVVGRLPWRLRGAFLQELAATFGGSNRAGGHSIRFLVSRLNRPVPTNCLRSPYRGTNRTLRDSISVPRLVFLPRPVIAGNAAIFSPCWMRSAS